MTSFAIAVRQAIQRANTYRFTNRGPIRLCIELMFLCGSDFATDPSYPELGAMLRGLGDQMQRAERIQNGSATITTRSMAPTASMCARRSRRLRHWPGRRWRSPGRLRARTAPRYARIFPLRTAYIGESALTMLIREGRAVAREKGLSTLRAEALIVVLMFAFGHGCVADPLYPWISQTLADEKSSIPRRAPTVWRKGRDMA